MKTVLEPKPSNYSSQPEQTQKRGKWKLMQAGHDWFLSCFSLAEKVTRVFDNQSQRLDKETSPVNFGTQLKTCEKHSKSYWYHWIMQLQSFQLYQPYYTWEIAAIKSASDRCCEIKSGRSLHARFFFFFFLQRTGVKRELQPRCHMFQMTVFNDFFILDPNTFGHDCASPNQPSVKRVRWNRKSWINKWQQARPPIPEMLKIWKLI